MKDEQLIQILEDAGLSPYQAEAYVTLLVLGNASATDVADRCDVPDPRIYDVLRDLESKDYVETYQQDNLTARAHDPETVLEDLQSRSSAYLDAAKEIQERWNEPPITEHEVSIVKRFDTVLSRARSLVDEAKTQVQFAGHVDQFRAMTDHFTDARERGVSVKLCLWTDGGTADLPQDSALSGVCSEARYHELPTPFVVIVDRTSTSFAPNRRSTDEYGVVVTDRTYSFVFHWYFLTALWENSETEYTEQSADSPTTYVDIRYCVRDLKTLLNEDATVMVTVSGYEMETTEAIEISGVVTNATYSENPTDDEHQLPLSRLSGRVSLTVDSGESHVEIGGWGAVTGEVEAETITIDEVRYE